MVSVIVYTNSNGGVSLCKPTGVIPIADVQAKDTPAGSVIIDEANLPQGNDALFFNSWELSGSAVSVNQTKAAQQQATALDQMAYAEAQRRAAKVGAGLTNVMTDADWATALTTARSAIAAAIDTNGLVNAVAPIQEAIKANTL